ncbi:MAG: alpha-2-macroglobulin family protein [Pyrinomonadaceae bacterium]|nr:alpha-2-macroglobulin family protein [Pyrinomonadaceae bacterium]
MKQLTTSIILLSIYLSVIAPFGTRAQILSKTMADKTQNTPPGLQFRLSEGVEGADGREKQPPASTDPLSNADAAKLLGRMPAIKADPDDQTDFAKRAGTLPAPKTGEKMPVKFPAAEARPTPSADGANRQLEVVRFSPEGEVSLAPDLNVTFSEPMVAVTSQDQAAAYTPVELSPQIEGRWRWLGTKTLMFDTDKRFPMATKFTARVPAGTKSATGQVLAKDVTWTFTTPAPKAVQMMPNGQTTKRDAIVFIAFDQAINPEAVLRSIKVNAAGKPVRIRLATEEEVNSYGSSTTYYDKQFQAGRWLAFRAINSDGTTENALPGNSQINVSIEKGTPSAEGPLVTTAAQSFSFRTFGPMDFVEAQCGWRKEACSPFENWSLQFSNAIDGSKFKQEMVTVTPAVPGLKIYPAGNYIYIQGPKKGRTTYTVNVDGGLTDIFGQQLGKTATATIKVGSAESTLYSQGGPMVVLDPAAKPSYSIFSVNHNTVRIRVRRVTPNDWHTYQDYYRNQYYDDGNLRKLPGTVISDKTVQIEKVADELTETRIDLVPFLEGGFGNLVLEIEPTVRRDKYDRTRILTWIQATQIGLDAFVDNQELVGIATDLKTGAPLSGVELSIWPDNGTYGGQLAANESEEGFLTTAWNWLMGVTGAGGPSAEALDANGDEVVLDEVEPAQSPTTGTSGVLRLMLPEKAASKGMSVLVAKKGKDVAFLPENSDYFWQDYGSWYKKGEADTLQWFVFDDRRMYKPKEEVSVKGYIRKRTAGELGDIESIGGPLTYQWSAIDPRNNEIAKGTITTNAFGAFDFKFKLPDNANLGYARVEFREKPDLSAAYSHQFQIQEFRRPEFEVSTKVETEAPHLVGSSANVSVEAKYYSGGGLANAETTWVVSASPTNYTPPNRDDYVFGVWVPWWRVYGYGGDRYSPSNSQTFKGVTDAAGKHVLKIDFDSVKPARPYTVTANASVQDVNRQTWASSSTLMVHPADLYVGIKSPRTFVQKGEKVVVDSIVTNIDGKLIAGRDIEIKALLKDWTFDQGSWKEVTVDEQTCNVRSAEDAVKCEFVAKNGGRYTVTATVMDDRERFNQSEMTIWVPGGKTPPNRDVEQEEVQIIPSKKDFEPGDVAELLVISPFTPAEGILTLRRDGIVKTERFTMKDSSVTLRIPIEEKYLPNIYAQVDIVGSAPRQNDKGEVDPKLSKRPAFASGNINLPVSIASRKLTVTAEPQDSTLAPGGETKVDIQVKDSRGEPVANSEVAVVIVDESVLALTRYSIADPAAIFYSARSTGTQDYHSRKDVLLGNPDDVAPPPPPPPPAGLVTSDASVSGVGRELAMAPAAKRAVRAELMAQEGETPINVRQNFDALAVFAPSVKTDGNGRATVDVKLPDNLTRYRITAVSVDQGKRFGKSESSITAKQPLMVRPSAPRFMNFGDKIELPVVVQNQTDQDMAVDVAVRGSNVVLTDVAGGSPLAEVGKRVLVRANSREEVRFPASPMKAGTARFQIAVTSGKHSDAAEISLPVWTPATAEAFATYGTTDKNGAIFQPVQTPGDVFPQFGGLEVTTSSTQLQELTDAFIYLTNYPYMCSEQISSRMISIAALRDVLQAFKAKDTPTAAQLDEYFKRDIQILQSRQRDDGSFGLWKRERERYEYPFLTVHVAHALGLAKAKGYKVPDEMITRVKPYLKDVEKYYRGEWYVSSPQVRWTISAYALYVRDMLGDKDAAKAKKLLAEATIEKMPFEALGWILSVLANDPGSAAEVESIKRFLLNRTTETASTANFVTNYGDGAWLIMYSNRRADGVLLEAMIKADPNNDLVPKLVRGLLAHRKKGHWGSTQENVFILLALDKYFNAFEKVTPDFVTRVWLGNAYAGEQAFRGRSVDSNVLNIPMSYLTEQGGTSNLILDKQGAGRLYYRIGMKYAPTNLKLEPTDNGFTVLRKYEAIDNADDVKQNADGSWTIRSGARVRVRITMVAQARRYHVALVDNLPAGLEILNPGLAVTEAIPADNQPSDIVTVGSRSMGRNYYWWRQYWFEHQNFRDERAEAFASLLWEGVYNYSYVTRATTPGEFVVPPAKAEEMYAPETFGRTGTDFVRVE